MANLKRDNNYQTTLAGITDDSNQTITNLIVDPTTKRLKVSATLSGTVAVANGGTGTTSFGTGYAVVITDSTGTGYLQALTSLGALGQVLTSNGPGAVPSFQAGGAGMTELNALNGAEQKFAIGTSGSGFNISSAGTTHTFNLPAASSTGSGYLKGGDWSIFNSKGSVLTFSLPLSVSETSVSISAASSSGSGYLKGADWVSFNSRGSILTFVLPLSVSGTSVSLSQASSTGTGYLTGADWTSFNSRGSILTFSLPLSVSGTNVSISQATSTGSGYLTSADWNSFNSRGSILTFSLPLSVSGTGVSISKSTSSGSGYLTGEDWTTFNNKADYSFGANNFSGTGSVTTTGNLNGASIVGTGTITGGGFNTAGYISATGTITGGNFKTAGQLNATGTVTGGGFETAGFISAGSATFKSGVQFNTTAYFDAEYSNGSTTTAGGTAINWNNGNKQFIGMASTTAIAFTQNPPNPCNLVLRLLQDGTGTRVITWPTTGGITIRWSGGTILSTGANKNDIASFYYAGGSTYYGILSTNFATY